MAQERREVLWSWRWGSLPRWQGSWAFAIVEVSAVCRFIFPGTIGTQSCALPHFLLKNVRCCRWKHLVQESHRKGKEQMSSPASTSEAHKKILLIAEPIVTTATTQVLTETCLGSWQMLKNRTRSTRSLTLRNPCYRDFGMVKLVHPLSID